jgi:uncharacterized protein
MTVETFDLLRANLLSPMVLAFVLGIVATLVKSNIEIPEPVYKIIGIYLLLSIGIKGGTELAGVTLSEFIGPALVALGLAVAIPFWSYAILRRLGKFSIENAAAIAAHYGSVSSVTFITAISLMKELNQPYEGFIPTLASFMEWGVVVALFIARWRLKRAASIKEVLIDTLSGRSVVLLLGGLVMGVLIGEKGYKQIEPFFGDLFRGILTLFLLEMGMVAAKQLREFAKVGPFMVGFGIVMPLVHGAIGVSLGTLAGLSLGGSFVMGAIAASSSYIDAPAAVRAAIPEANPSIYLTSSLGITFPFNILVGLPLYYELARWLHT